MCYVMTWKPCLTIIDNDHYQGFLPELHANASVSTQIFIILRDIELNLVIIYYDDANDAESTIMTSKTQNYHFAI